MVLYDHYPQTQLDGRTSVMTVGVNVATQNGLHFFQGAGNHGHDADPETSRLVQAHPEWTVADLRQALTRTAHGSRADGTPDPLFVRGYGILDARAALDFTPGTPGRPRN